MDALFPVSGGRQVIQIDQRRWESKHQVLANRHLSPWRVLLRVKITEMVLQCRPKALCRTYLQPDRRLRQAMRWYGQMGRRVWPHEILAFLHSRFEKNGPALEAFWGGPRDAEERAMVTTQTERTPARRRIASM